MGWSEMEVNNDSLFILKYTADRAFFLATVPNYGRLTFNAHNGFKKVVPKWVADKVTTQYRKFFEMEQVEPHAGLTLLPREHPKLADPLPDPVVKLEAIVNTDLTVAPTIDLPLRTLAMEIINKERKAAEKRDAIKLRNKSNNRNSNTPSSVMSRKVLFDQRRKELAEMAEKNKMEEMRDGL